MNPSNESFRDSISTITNEGKRRWLYPKKPKGTLYRYRTYVSYVLLALMFSGPFITVNGLPILLLNIVERKFILFGTIFWPQDFNVFVFLMITAILFIVLFTSIFGRIWCGWLCPQTIFMEMVFRKIEYFIEGDAVAQKKLNTGKGNHFLIKKLTKHIIFYLLSFLIANTFLAYIIGIDELEKIISEPIYSHISGFITIQLFTLAFYAVFSWFREQACVIVCPYGRFQGVMIDENSIAVTYDFKRGEQRGKLSKEEREQKYQPDFSGWENRGDCVDCFQCVNVCPTGIDIRNGIQLECVNCTACMDACDSVMTKQHLPTGLIRYSSYNAIETGEKKIFTPRIIAYSVVLTLMIAVSSFFLSTRTPFEAIILRQPGTLYQTMNDSTYSNMYQYKLVNKTLQPTSFHIKIIKPEGNVSMVGKNHKLPEQGIIEGRFFAQFHKKNIQLGKTKIIFGIYSDTTQIETVYSSFIGPEK